MSKVSRLHLKTDNTVKSGNTIKYLFNNKKDRACD